MANRNWTREEHILAFNLYCKIPFTKINANYPPVKELAQILNRSDGSVAMKLANFARLDPALKARNVSGLTQGAKGEEEVWNEFNGNWEKLSFQSELLLAKRKHEPIEKLAEIDIRDLPTEGKERKATVKTRVNQSFFRKMILASYGSKCCVTGIAVPQLLVASHIIPWSNDKKNRMNPSNGLCMNALHDKAFDRGLISVSSDLRICLSKYLVDFKDKETINSYFLPFADKSIRMPQRFAPQKEFLEHHYQKIFLDNKS